MLSTFVGYVFAVAELVAGLLTVPATVGELWIVGYLILFGVREHAGPDPDSTRVAGEDPIDGEAPIGEEQSAHKGTWVPVEA